ncbi:hypothetical protein ACP0AK_12080 [Listeria ivanovii]|uniref:Uncharacterized protein n=1 Tax=Listeria ivanovii (strain ATCC BAA-678 / PAM 55) TaxID=881621 RepID=G2ZAK8_LISIP|nr:hypothetical protein [Listeria ivanovii]AHI54890.1 hypothetical protein AX25_01770 [Listeria ivanovii WSLC3009]AIS64352.1 hypothetical protein JL52_01750 [Listeria ivanovii subsp. ivanovii]MBC1760266.1 hypothetical protein [Listeria ivanovii]MBK3915320.1 hypothetical protein [Listeria ivanovii subsp. ivanovii]MBK3922448.1 hypothetical protein [Listeria ivanovii subsp. ivanovii]
MNSSQKEILLSEHPKYISEIEKNGVDNLNPESIDGILDILLTSFVNYGLEDNDEPNNYGLEIEHLIDLVNDAE